jgi:hypothetical protein
MSCQQHLQQTISSQKLLHIQSLFFAHMKLGLVPKNLYKTASPSPHRAHSVPKCAKKAFPYKIFLFRFKSGVKNLLEF